MVLKVIYTNGFLQERVTMQHFLMVMVLLAIIFPLQPAATSFRDMRSTHTGRLGALALLRIELESKARLDGYFATGEREKAFTERGLYTRACAESLRALCAEYDDLRAVYEVLEAAKKLRIELGAAREKDRAAIDATAVDIRRLQAAFDLLYQQKRQMLLAEGATELEIEEL